ncbi:MAG: DUF1236 domain-containing protein [Xanthobacteraceae bacterium]
MIGSDICGGDEFRVHGTEVKQTKADHSRAGRGAALTALRGIAANIAKLLVPQYRGFDYFLVEDEIVIVDPRTLEIVAIIPA